jgi:hypothetical protein
MGVVDNIKEDIENLIKILNDLLDSAKLLRLTINFINKYHIKLHIIVKWKEFFIDFNNSSLGFLP